MISAKGIFAIYVEMLSPFWCSYTDAHHPYGGFGDSIANDLEGNSEGPTDHWHEAKAILITLALHRQRLS